MKNIVLTFLICAGVAFEAFPQFLKFNTENFTQRKLSMPDGYVVNYKSYEGIYYVQNVEDSVFQVLNIFVPENMRKNSPIFLRTYTGGYMASRAKLPSPNDASGRALEEGYVVCIPASRGSNSFVHKELYAKNKKNGKKKKLTGEFETVYTGKFPAGLLDLKAAVRYLRANDDLIEGNSQKIITDGTSAGGAMSALLGATGNHPDYEKLLEKMGAAKASDNVWTVVSYCPITDLEHADMAYEWLYACTDNTTRKLSKEQTEVSEKLASMYAEYLKSLNLKNPVSGELLTVDNYANYLKSWLIASVEQAMEHGEEIADTLGLIFYDESKFGRYLVDIDLSKYLEYVSKCQKLKTPPAFDVQNLAENQPSAENKAFGLSDGTPLNFTKFSCENIDTVMLQRVKMMNPMNYITDSKAVKAPNWYIRHGAKDRDTGFQISLNLALKLYNNGFNVNYFLPWGIAHTGDYNLNELFDYLDSLEKNGK
ncbi:MAG: alpha/beta hydrolase [Bacteroidales bacterium]|nr:alpha/beta hydrolase [Bacteroidales bacterium]